VLNHHYFNQEIYMKRVLVLILAFCLSLPAMAGTRHVHKWAAGGPKDYSGYISLTNSCNSHSADVTIKYWRADGSVLSNYTLQSGYVTDSNGEIDLTLGAHQSVTVTVAHNNFGTSTSTGSARVTTSYSEPGTPCIVGGYGNYSTPFGFHESFILNNGRRF
jgi:hypothetical protein